MKKKKSIKRIIKHKLFRKRNILALLNLLLSIVLIVLVSILDFLTLKYNLLLIIGLLLINIVSFLLINVHEKIYLKIIGWFIISITSILAVIGIYYLNTTNNFMNDSFSKKDLYTKNSYLVISKQGLKEKAVKGTVAVYKETLNLNKAYKKLTKKYSLEKKEYLDLGNLFDCLNSGSEKYALIEKSSYQIVFNTNQSLKEEDYQIIYEFDVFTKNKTINTENSNKFNIYIGGTDFAGLMDFNMLVSVNTKTHQILLTSIPRDYYIEVVGKDGRYDKLSFMSAYGPETNKDSLEKLFNTKIDYSIKLNTTSLVEVVDYLGGIDFCSEYEYTTTHALVKNYNDKGPKLKVSKGCQHLNGIETLTVARERNAFPGRDRVRQENCQKILLEIIKKLVSTDSILHYNETLQTMSSLYETNIPKKIITNAVKDILKNGNNWEIGTQAIDGVDGKDKVHLSNMIDWVMYPDQESVLNASKKIEDMLK